MALIKKIVFTVLIVCFFRFGSNVPVPGLDVGRIDFTLFFDKTYFNIFDIFSGGAFSKMSLFSLGVIPYITASILFQLLSTFYKPLMMLRKEEITGYEKTELYIKYFSFFLAVFQAVCISFYISISLIKHDFIYFYLVVTTLVTGSMVVIWLCELINNYGIGNGVSIIICSGILSAFFPTIFSIFEKLYVGEISIFKFSFLSLMFIFILLLVLFFEQSYYKIGVNFLSKQCGIKVYAAQRSFLPLKVNISGVISPIFATSVLLFPLIICQLFVFSENIRLNSFAKFLSTYIYPGSFFFILLNIFLIFFFCLLYTTIIFDILSRIFNVSFFFGGTSLLIVVVVIIDLLTSVQSLAVSNKYKKYK